MASKPFTPEEARRNVQFLQKPAVFLNMTTDWPALHWTVEHLSTCLTKRLRFRIGKRTEDKGKPQTNITQPLKGINKILRVEEVHLPRT